MARQPGHCFFRVGSLRLVALHDGNSTRDRPTGFVMNATEIAVDDAAAAIGLPRGKNTLSFTALAIEHESGVVLLDAGFGSSGPPGTGHLLTNLAAAGHSAEQVAAVLISHFHGDHIGGLLTADGLPAFPNATIHVPQPEWDFWIEGETGRASPAVQRVAGASRRVFETLVDRIKPFAWGAEILPGVTALAAGGHTPGHTMFEVGSQGDRLLFVGDIVNNPLIFACHVEWQVSVDLQPDIARATREGVFARAVDEHLRLFFYHAPFPANGFLIPMSEGYGFAPALWEVDG